jgi:hypothetical protein
MSPPMTVREKNRQSFTVISARSGEDALPKVFTVPSGSVMRSAPRPARPKRSKAPAMHFFCKKVGGLVRIVIGLSGTGLSW